MRQRYCTCMRRDVVPTEALTALCFHAFMLRWMSVPTAVNPHLESLLSESPLLGVCRFQL